MKLYPSQIPGLPLSDDGQAILVSGSFTGGATGGATETTLAALRAAVGAPSDAAATSPSGTNALVALVKLLAQVAVGYDSTGGALPYNFNSLPVTNTYSAGVIQTTARTNGTNTWTQTFTYTGSDLTGISAWVKS